MKVGHSRGTGSVAGHNHYCTFQNVDFLKHEGMRVSESEDANGLAARLFSESHVKIVIVDPDVDLDLHFVVKSAEAHRG
jgi:hypothetical protein